MKNAPIFAFLLALVWSCNDTAMENLSPMGEVSQNFTTGIDTFPREWTVLPANTGAFTPSWGDLIILSNGAADSSYQVRDSKTMRNHITDKVRALPSGGELLSTTWLRPVGGWITKKPIWLRRVASIKHLQNRSVLLGSVDIHLSHK